MKKGGPFRPHLGGEGDRAFERVGTNPASPVLADVDGDGLPEIVVGEGLSGRLWGVTGRGETAPGFPIRTGSEIIAPVTAADLDGDGDVDLLALSGDGGPGGAVHRGSCQGGGGPVDGLLRRGGRRALKLGDTTMRGDDGWDADVLPLVAGGPTAPPDGTTRLRLSPRVPLPFRATEVHIVLPRGAPLEGEILEYTVGGKTHPSPVLGGPVAYSALIQPLATLKSVELACTLLWKGGGSSRLPSRDGFGLRDLHGLGAEHRSYDVRGRRP